MITPVAHPINGSCAFQPLEQNISQNQRERHPRAEGVWAGKSPVRRKDEKGGLSKIPLWQKTTRRVHGREPKQWPRRVRRHTSPP